MAITFPFFSWGNKRNEMRGTDKESGVSTFKHGSSDGEGRNKIRATDKESQVSTFEHVHMPIAQQTRASFLDTHTISSDGYMQVAELRSDDLMESFIRRLLLAHGKTVNDDGALKGFVPWFSGSKATQSFSEMKEQLFKKPWVVDASDLATKSSP